MPNQVNAQCDTPIVTAYALAASCTNNIANNDGYLQISAATDATHYNYTMGSDYSSGDTDITNATALGALSLQFGALTNPTGSQDYTIRVFNGTSDCFLDVIVTLQEQNCTSSCNCEEYIYLNEPVSESIHKFSVNADSTLTEILNNGNAWYDNTLVAGETMISPHGLAADLNGFLYIAETGGGGASPGGPTSSIRKFNCDGTIQPTSATTITYTGHKQNLFSIGNTLYGNKEGGPTAFDLCTGQELGQACLDNADGLPIASDMNVWGLSYNDVTEMVYATSRYTGGGAFSNTNHENKALVWAFSRTELESAVSSGTCINPFIEMDTTITTLQIGDNATPNTVGSLMGIVGDDDGNMYVVKSALEGGTGGQILKYNISGYFIGESPIATTGSYSDAIGIVWSRATNLLFVSNLSLDAGEDCISIFNTNVEYVGTAIPNPPDGADSYAKAIAINNECCPSPNRQTFNQTHCATAEPVFLNDLVDCNGVICEGQWTPTDAASTAIYNDCNQSILGGTAPGCYSFTKSSNGLESYPKCGAFQLTFDLEILAAPAISVSADVTICSGGTTTLSVTTASTDIQWQKSSISCTEGFANIDGATGANYTTEAVNDTTYYRAIVNATGNCSTGSCPFESDCITVNTELNEARIYALAASCTNDVPNDDAYFLLASVDGATHYNYTVGSDYSTGDPDISNATVIDSGALPMEFGGPLANPTGSQDYTFRVFNSNNGCFRDYVVTLQEQDCTITCSCDEYIYLNEPESQTIHKFEVNADGTLTEILNNGNAWFDNNLVGETMVSPHGLASDLNGFLYIAETGGGGASPGGPTSSIRKFNCDGTIEPASATTITYTGLKQNIFSIDNTLYGNTVGGPSAFDLCTGASLGQACLNNGDGTPIPLDINLWGLSYNEITETVYATSRYWGSGGFTEPNDANKALIWAFSKNDLENAVSSGTCIDPFIEMDPAITTLQVGDNATPNTLGSLMGIVGDDDGNIYVVKSFFEGGAGSQIFKYDINGNFVAESPLQAIGDYASAIGIVWSRETNLLFMSNFTVEPDEDCISAFNTNVQYVGTAVPNPPTGASQAKAISIIKECCPSPNRQTINETYCVTGSNEQLFLNDLMNCDGVICEGQWIPVDAASTGVYNDCNQSISAGIAPGCYSFTKGTDGLENFPKCGAFELNFNLEIIAAPAITVSADTTICNGATATLNVTTTNTDIQWQMSTTSCTDGFTNIAGATSATYTTTTLSSTTYYRAIANEAGDCSAGSCPFESDCITISTQECCTPEPCIPISVTKNTNE